MEMDDRGPWCELSKDARKLVELLEDVGDECSARRVQEELRLNGMRAAEAIEELRVVGVVTMRVVRPKHGRGRARHLISLRGFGEQEDEVFLQLRLF